MENTSWGASLNTTPLDSFTTLTETFLSHGHPTSEAALARYLDKSENITPAFDYNNATPISPAETRFDDLWPQNQSQSLTRSTASLKSAPAVRYSTRRDPEMSNVINELGLIMRILCRNIPRSINSNALMRESYYMFTIAQCECLSAAQGTLSYEASI